MTTTEVGSRPYSRMRDQPPSVTTILNELSKDGLQWASSKEAALFAVHSQDEWQGLEPPEAVDLIRKHFRGVWDNRAKVGTVVHSVMEAWAAGQAVDVATLCANTQGWSHVMDERIAEVMLYVDGLEKFWTEWKPTEIRSEEIVRQPDHYIGTRDLVCTMRGERWLLDLKNTQEKNPDKGYYVDSWATQLAAYRYAREVVTFKRGPKNKMMVDTVDLNEPVDRCGVIHLRGNGDYSLLEIDAGPEALDIFTSLAQVHAWRKTLKNPTALNRTEAAA